jgi:retron-type reverse transcriptase
LLANLFLHYVFDSWMVREFRHVPFCRYADDGVPRTRRLRPESEGVEVML